MKDVRLFLYFVIALCATFMVWKFSTCFSTSKVRVERVDLSFVRLKDEQKLEVASVKSIANGRIGETYIVHTPFGDYTAPLRMFVPGVKYADFENIPMVTVLGFDASVDSGRIFNSGSYGEWNRSRTVFTMRVFSRIPGILRVYSEGAVDRSDSYFAGRLDSVFYQEAIREMVGNPSYAAFANAAPYADYCYAKAIKAFAEQYYAMSEGHPVEVVVFIGENNFEKMVPTGEVTSIGSLNVDKIVVKN